MDEYGWVQNLDGISKLWLQTCSKKNNNNIDLPERPGMGSWLERGEWHYAAIDSDPWGWDRSSARLGNRENHRFVNAGRCSKKSCSTSANWVEFLILNIFLVLFSEYLPSR